MPCHHSWGRAIFYLGSLTLPPLMRSQIAFISCCRIVFRPAVDIASVLGNSGLSSFFKMTHQRLSDGVYFDKGSGPRLCTTGRCLHSGFTNNPFLQKYLLKIFVCFFWVYQSITLPGFIVLNPAAHYFQYFIQSYLWNEQIYYSLLERAIYLP